MRAAIKPVILLTGYSEFMPRVPVGAHVGRRPLAKQADLPRNSTVA